MRKELIQIEQAEDGFIVRKTEDRPTVYVGSTSIGSQVVEKVWVCKTLDELIERIRRLTQ